MSYAKANCGADIYYEMHGSGTPILMSAGMGGSGAFWTPQLAALTEHHTVILYDHVGTGRSKTVTIQPHSIARMSDDLACVMNAAGVDRAHIVGHAIGGIVGLQFAMDHAHRLSSLTVVNGWGRADAFLRRCFEVRKLILNQSGPAAYVRAQPLFLFPPQWISENTARLDEEEERILEHFPDVATMNQRIEMFLAFDPGDRLAAIKTPTLVTTATDDALVPAYLTRELAAVIPGARLVEVPWGAHAFTTVTPDVFNTTLLAFCADVDASRTTA